VESSSLSTFFIAGFVMASTNALSDAPLPQQAYQQLTQGNYEQAAWLYEQATELEPEIKTHIWYLGLALLLQGQEAEAQTVWLFGMADGEPDQIEQWTAELIEVLQTEADRQEELQEYASAWLIRQHLRETAPYDLNNLLRIVHLSMQLGTFTGEDLANLNLVELLQSNEAIADSQLLLSVLKSLLSYAPLDPHVLEFATACLGHAQQPVLFVDILLQAAIEIAHVHRRSDIACHFGELCLQFNAAEVEVLRHLSAFYLDAERYAEAIEAAHRCYDLTETVADRLYANHLLLKCLLGATGYWQKTCEVMERHQTLLRNVIEAAPANLDAVAACRLSSAPFFLPYFKDDPQTVRPLQNQVGEICQTNFRNLETETFQRFYQSGIKRRSQPSPQKLKIGYLSHCFKQHSVGWIARWLFQHHDRSKFQTHVYLMNQFPVTDFAQEWFVNHVDRAYAFKVFDKSGIVEQIHRDEIDILIDLDSITLDSVCELLSLKPAPVQVTWLGWDALGLPAIDYFIADSYVLPESAQDYYSEKIWRLPQTYVAVDGFEVGVPSIRRDQLGIPQDAIVYLVVQRGYKRHPDNVKLQMQILREVPNSYLLIKGIADVETSTQFYEQLAEAEGVSGDRLRFLPWANDETVHRANLGIADVVLDTYPYNGATTTLETLWMGIPMVTRVGQQFAARNSYTMMVNVGLTEGIAWTDEEYVDWGVRLGKDAALRQQISWHLWRSRQTAPLWNAKQFTREMENAYTQMWAKFVAGN
jgi:predicted O-linked N-acetylglucosamine transferase (SPINDLY family)